MSVRYLSDDVVENTKKKNFNLTTSHFNATECLPCCLVCYLEFLTYLSW